MVPKATRISQKLPNNFETHWKNVAWVASPKSWWGNLSSDRLFVSQEEREEGRWSSRKTLVEVYPRQSDICFRAFERETLYRDVLHTHIHTHDRFIRHRNASYTHTHSHTHMHTNGNSTKSQRVVQAAY